MRTNTKKIKRPKVNSKLAYLCGVLAGDGYIGIRKNKSEYVVNCGGNPKDEKEFYNQIIAPLMFDLFGVEIDPSILGGYTYGFNLWSKELVFFLLDDIGMTKSPKNNLKIPKIFLRNDLALAFIRGVADTDFSFKLRNGKYPIISGCAKSKTFMEEISTILETNGFKLAKCFDYKVTDHRLKAGHNIINRIYINGNKNFSLWLDLIGTEQLKNKRKIEQWKRNSGGRI